MNRLRRACRRLGMRVPNQFGWDHTLDFARKRTLMLRELGYRGLRVELIRHDPPGGKLSYSIRRGNSTVQFDSLSQALEWLADRTTEDRADHG